MFRHEFNHFNFVIFWNYDFGRKKFQLLSDFVACDGNTENCNILIFAQCDKTVEISKKVKITYKNQK